MTLPSIPYEQVVELVERLPEEQQKELLQRLLTRHSQPQALTIEDRLKLLDAIKLDVAFNEEPSVRRVDWYDDDGR